MTYYEAVQEVRRRWGDAGRAMSRNLGGNLRSRRVGEKVGGMIWYLGEGSTWEEAFADADRRANLRSAAPEPGKR